MPEDISVLKSAAFSMVVEDPTLSIHVGDTTFSTFSTEGSGPHYEIRDFGIGV